jgi:Endoplasmic reticulum vesicle transporter
LHHDLAPHMANVSHEIHHLSIGEPIGRTMLETGKVKVPDSVKQKLAPMDNNVYINYDLHQAYHHYLKVITTEVPTLMVGRRQVKAYQILQNSQLAMYRNDIIPEAKFVLDLSPISVSYQKTKTPFYDYLTSVMAIIGGTFTMVGLLESSLQAAVGSRKRR